MKSWEFKDDPLVRMVCVTYNHELFIKYSLEGFLKKETRFPIEIII